MKVLLLCVSLPKLPIPLTTSTAYLLTLPQVDVATLGSFQGTQNTCTCVLITGTMPAGMVSSRLPAEVQ